MFFGIEQNLAGSKGNISGKINNNIIELEKEI